MEKKIITKGDLKFRYTQKVAEQYEISKWNKKKKESRQLELMTLCDQGRTQKSFNSMYGNGNNYGNIRRL